MHDAMKELVRVGDLWCLRIGKKLVQTDLIVHVHTDPGTLATVSYCTDGDVPIGERVTGFRKVTNRATLWRGAGFKLESRLG